MKDASRGYMTLSGLTISIPQANKTYNFGRAEDRPTVEKTPIEPMIIKIDELELLNEMDITLEGKELEVQVAFAEKIIGSMNSLILGTANILNAQEMARREAAREERAHNKDMRLIEMKHEIELKKLDDTLDAAKHRRIQSRRNVGDLGT